jgi:GNAT superfamily N-acetyltransferase
MSGSELTAPSATREHRLLEAGGHPDRARPDHTIRVYRQGDIGLIHALSDHLSAKSLYHRFFIGTPRIPMSYLHSLETVDHWDREVLIALREDTHAIAITEYTRDAAHPWRADLAMLVADAWQRRGLARLLLGTLGQIALSRGITHFTADVLADNEAAQAAIGRHRPGSPSVQGSDGLKHFLLQTRPCSTRR